MTNPQGTVVSIFDAGGHRRAIVAVDPAAACPRCAAGNGCGAGIFQGRGDVRHIEVDVPDGLSPGVDDVVEVTLAPENILRAAALVYGLPLLGAALGAVLAYSASLGDAGASLLALAGLAIGLLASRWQLHRPRCSGRYTPSIERLC